MQKELKIIIKILPKIVTWNLYKSDNLVDAPSNVTSCGTFIHRQNNTLSYFKVFPGYISCHKLRVLQSTTKRLKRQLRDAIICEYVHDEILRGKPFYFKIKL